MVGVTCRYVSVQCSPCMWNVGRVTICKFAEAFGTDGVTLEEVVVLQVALS